MNLEKKEFDGIYLDYYNKISSYGNSTVTEVSDYSPVSENIQGLYWEGDNKDAVSDNIKMIDTVCNTMSSIVGLLVKKTKIVYYVLYPDLIALKDAIKAFNATVDAILSTLAEIAEEEERIAASQKEGENSGA